MKRFIFNVIGFSLILSALHKAIPMHTWTWESLALVIGLGLIANND